MLWHKLQGVGGFYPLVPEYIGGISAAGASSLDAGTITGAAIGDTFILAASDDSKLAEVTATGWSGMSSNFPDSHTVNSIDYAVCTRVNTGSGNTVSTIDGDQEITPVDAICAVAFRNIGTPPSTPSASQSTSGNSFNLPSMTVSESGSTAVIIAMIDDDDATISSVPTGYTLAVQNGRTGGSMAIMYQLDPPVGSTGTASGTWTNTDALYTIGYIIPPPA